MQAKMPVVIGQPIVAPCFRAIAARNSFVVTSRPRGTCRIRASISVGAGMAHVPVPHRVLILPVIVTTLGRPLLKASFSRQVLRRAIGATSGKYRGVWEWGSSWPHCRQPVKEKGER